MNQRGGDVQADQKQQGLGAGFVQRSEKVKQPPVERNQGRNLQAEQHESPAVEQRVPEAGQRLRQKQGVKPILSQLGRPLLGLGHAGRKRRQIGETEPPGQTCDHHQQGQHPC